jgi:hypothetical protein
MRYSATVGTECFSGTVNSDRALGALREIKTALGLEKCSIHGYNGHYYGKTATGLHFKIEVW